VKVVRDDAMMRLTKLTQTLTMKMMMMKLMMMTMMMRVCV